jgi:hypothetical protein
MFHKAQLNEQPLPVPFNEFAKPVIYSGLELPSNLNSSSKRKDYNIASEENENTDKS